MVFNESADLDFSVKRSSNTQKKEAEPTYVMRKMAALMYTGARYHNIAL